MCSAKLVGRFVGRSPRGIFRQTSFLMPAGRQYLVEVKSLSEGRRDRLIPLLAQAILQAKTAAAKCPSPTVPVAVVGSSRVSNSVAEEARRFAARHAPEVGAGVVDAEGLRVFTGHGLERFNASPTPRTAAAVTPRARPPPVVLGSEPVDVEDPTWANSAAIVHEGTEG